MENLEKTIGYTFSDKNHLKTALVHTSYANENKCKSYERLEFLGDSVLSLVVSDYLCSHMRKEDEGDLSRIRASLVCEESLASVARKINLGKYIMLGNGEEKSGSRERSSILCDVVEAVIAAVYVDGGIDRAKDVILKIMNEELDNALNNKALRDYKTQLQEYVQQKTHGRSKILYNIVGQDGPEHMKSFSVELLINSKVISTGKGKSKKEAEQEAAKKALTEGLV